MTTRSAPSSAAQTLNPATQPATGAAPWAYTHTVNIETAFLRRGTQDSDVIYDTIPAGSRVRAVGASDAFLRVVTEDGREGLVANNRLKALPVADAPPVKPAFWKPLPETRRAEELVMPPRPAPSAEPGPKEIAASIDKAGAFLLKQQLPNGAWDPPAAGGAFPTLKKTALATLAIRMVPSDGRNQTEKAWTLLNTHPNNETATIAFQSMGLFPNEKDKTVRDSAFGAFFQGHAADNPMFGPSTGDKEFDGVSSALALRGIANLEQHGKEVPQQFWANADERWRAGRRPDGGWTLPGAAARAPSDIVDTSAALVALCITDGYRASPAAPCNGNFVDADFDGGIRWLAAQLPGFWADLANGKVSDPCQTLWWLDSVLETSGIRRLGGNDVGAEMVAWLVAHQQPDGSWGQSVRETAHAMLILGRYRQPASFNKLNNHSRNWNQRPWDVAHLNAYVSDHLCEAAMQWNVVDIDDPVDDLESAPVLFMSGSGEFDLAVAQREKLKAYVEAGGLILGNADCGSKDFTRSFERLATQIFPQYELRILPGSHPIFAVQFLAAKWKTKPQVRGLSNGVREMMILIPDSDISRAWQQNLTMVRAEAFQLAANIVLYARGRNLLAEEQRRQPLLAPPPVLAARLNVARLRAGDNWNPEPNAWRRMHDVMLDDGVDVHVETIPPGQGGMKGHTIAHLTGTTKLVLSAEAKKEIGAFVDRGGVLLVDAAGGSTEFADSAEEELKKIFGDDAKEMETPLTAEALAALPGWKPIDRISYRMFARRQLTGSLHIPRLRGISRKGRIGVFYSREDLTAGMADVRTDGILGYEASTATALVENLLLYAAATRR